MFVSYGHKAESSALQIYTDTKRAIRLCLLRTMQPCTEMVLLMSESLERSLSSREHFTLRLHLLVCAWCSRYLKQIKLLRQVLRLQASEISADPSPSISLPPEARERIASVLNR